MKEKSYLLEFITPAFLSGADQSRAELRAPSVRGALRWWFRALGGTREEEAEVFGGVHGGAKRSKVIIRVEIDRKGDAWTPPQIAVGDAAAYVWHFARESSEKSRWSSDGVLSPGTKWKLIVLWQGESTDAARKRFDNALKCFLVLGALGLRVTRGLGAFVLKDASCTFEDVRKILIGANFSIEVKNTSQRTFASTIGSLVKGTRKEYGWRNDCKNKSYTPSPMGTPSPRQTSAIHFRPIALDSGAWQLVVFSPPYERVLGEESRRDKRKIVGVQPSALVAAESGTRRF